METITLNAQKREEKGRSVKHLRNEDKIPAEVYGHGFENQTLTVGYNEFKKVLEAAGESTLVDLAVEGGETVKVLIHDVQADSLSDRFTHVDFRQVNMKEKVDAEVHIVFEGVSPAVKEQGGIFVQQIDSIHIKALPGDLMHEINLDLGKLANIGDKIYVRDLELAEGIEILNDPSVVIAAVEAQRVEEEETTTSEEEEALLEERKAEGGDAAEGDDKKDPSAGSGQAKEEKSE